MNDTARQHRYTASVDSNASLNHATWSEPPRGSALLRSLAAFLRTELAVMFQYRVEVALWAIWGLVYPAVAFAMWSAAMGDAAALGGYAARDFAAYFLLSMIVSHIVAAWDIFEMGYLVRTGAMSPRLLRPILPIWGSLMSNLAFKIVTLALLIPAWLVIGWLFQPALAWSPANAALGAVAVALAAAVNYVLGYTVGLAAFWSTKVDALADLWFGGGLVFGGRMAPLALLPWPLGPLSMLLPFRWTLWFPVEVLRGGLSGQEIAIGLGVQAIWLVVGIIVFRLLWRAAIQRYSAVGA